MLDTVTVEDSAVNSHFLPEVAGTSVFSGKKTESIVLSEGQANLAQNIGRMALARLPGVNVWDMDGAGTQLNIGVRGSDPHRSIEMNMRQNGYNTNSDMFGYPEDHYTPPLQGVREIQLVRGASSLQFGPQFGGMMNYKMKEGDPAKPFSFESEETLGSDNFFNSYNAAGGKIGPVRYYAYCDIRHGDGWRPNAAFNYRAYYGSVGYQFNESGRVTLQFSSMDYVQQIAGGLTDAQFYANARQSTRSRNFFRPIINIPALLFDYDLASDTHLNVTLSAVSGERSSVQFINTPNVPDAINPALGTYNPRQVDRDFYDGFTTEIRLLRHYRFGSISSEFAGGLRYFDEKTKRQQKGVGTTAGNFDLSLASPYGIDLRFHTVNYAAFAENILHLTDRLSLTPGFRYERIESKLHGVINNASFPVSYRGTREFPLFGVGAQYQATATTQFYGNFTQAYRPYLYAFITPADQLGVIDPNLKDSRGNSTDFGYRGSVDDTVNFDLSVYHVYYGNRIGQLTIPSGNTTTLYTTNIGTAVIQGVETYVNLSLTKLAGSKSQQMDLSVFNSLGYNHGRYTRGAVTQAGVNVDLTGNRLESTPEWVERAGIVWRYESLTSTAQVSRVGKSFSDANNTVFNPTGATGVVPAYTVYDWAFSYRFFRHYSFSGGINNLADARYFTRRINMYPGPGILPADGRTFYLAVGLSW